VSLKLRRSIEAHNGNAEKYKKSETVAKIHSHSVEAGEAEILSISLPLNFANKIGSSKYRNW